MLESLMIRHIALIDEVTIHFHSGMQVLTGETGAGKSIVVDSVNLILGGRAERELIRSGSDRASVEALFNVNGNGDIRKFMNREEIEYDGDHVTVYREISSAGKNVCRICGVMIPVSRLKELAPALMDLHGQNEHQFLADPERHLAFLDQTGDDRHSELILKTKKDFDMFINNHRAYAKLVRQNENRNERMRSLERDLEDLRKAGIKSGEATELMRRRKELENAQKESELLRSASEFLSGDDNSGGLLKVKLAADDLRAAAVRDPSTAEISSKCEALYYELEDIAYQISLKVQNYDYDPAEMEKTEDRLALIHRLERRFGTEADAMPSYLKKMEDEYRHLSDLENEIENIAAEHKRLLSQYRDTAKLLSESRRQLAADFENKMMNELRDLGMGNTRFYVEFKPNNSGRPMMPTETGDDRIEFLISPNPGEPLKPLAKIASGGELSRLMLAVKSLESASSGVETMVFDEIDTGISGRMAQVVAEKMNKLSKERQVICVTHLPQIASAADFHYLVRKTVSEGRTSTSVEELDRDGRIREISRMISGADGITSQSDAYAHSLIQAAQLQKQNIDR